jgi:hypothetical protein
MLFGAWGESGGGGQVSAKSLGKEMGVAAAREHGWNWLEADFIVSHVCREALALLCRLSGSDDLEFQGFESKSNSPDHLFLITQKPIMFIRRKERVATYACLFKEGVCVVKKDSMLCKNPIFQKACVFAKFISRQCLTSKHRVFTYM